MRRPTSKWIEYPPAEPRKAGPQESPDFWSTAACGGKRKSLSKKQSLLSQQSAQPLWLAFPSSAKMHVRKSLKLVSITFDVLLVKCNLSEYNVLEGLIATHRSVL